MNSTVDRSRMVRIFLYDILEKNIFHRINHNPTFIVIFFITIVLQAIIVQFGGFVFHVPRRGLSGMAWLACLVFGFGSIIVGFLARLLPDIRFVSANSITADGNHGSQASLNAQQNWKKAINATTTQIRVVNAFKEPLKGKGVTVGGRISRRSSHSSLVTIIRGGRSTGDDYAAFQFTDINGPVKD